MRTARTLCQIALLFVLLPTGAIAQEAAAALGGRAQPRPRAERTVVLARSRTPRLFLTLAAALHAAEHPGVLLLESAEHPDSLRDFVTRFEPTAVIPLGYSATERRELEMRLHVKTTEPLAWDDDWDSPAWQALVPSARAAVVCPPEPYARLLQAAALAGTLRAPLLVTEAKLSKAPALTRCLKRWGVREVYAVGAASALCRELGAARVIKLRSEAAVAARALRARGKTPVRTLVVANPADRASKGGMSMLAPWIAARQRAPLLLTNDAGDDVSAKVDAVIADPLARRAENIVLVGTPAALPPQRRNNPLKGKDEFIEAEPLTPEKTEPCSFAVGRLFHRDPAIVALQLARPRLLPRAATAPPRALVVSNPGGGLPLLETFSRHTALELRNAGYEVAALFGDDVNRDDVRRLLPRQNVFLWEGHHSTLVRSYGVHTWHEPLAPSLVFLQSCLALHEEKATPFLERGALGVVGAASRTYSGSGGALSLSYFDALVYERQTLGGALRHAKNFLLAFALLKEKRLGTASKLSGANVRSAWAFTLWGDPTQALPVPEIPAGSLQPIRHHVRGSTIVVHLPDETHQRVFTSKYQAQIWPGARLAGLRGKTDNGDGHPLIPLLFFEVNMPRAPAGKAPRLRTRLPDAAWVFCWDRRRNVGYLLVRPRARDRGELRFQVGWE